MVEPDTIRLLRECDSGIQMGISSIQDVERYAQDPVLKKALETCKNTHIRLDRELRKLLRSYKDQGKSPNPLVKFMSQMKTKIKLSLNRHDKTIADLMTDGCNMGVKSLSKYLNQYHAADEESKAIAKNLISSEHQLGEEVRRFL